MWLVTFLHTPGFCCGCGTFPKIQIFYEMTQKSLLTFFKVLIPSYTQHAAIFYNDFILYFNSDDNDVLVSNSNSYHGCLFLLFFFENDYKNIARIIPNSTVLAINCDPCHYCCHCHCRLWMRVCSGLSLFFFFVFGNSYDNKLLKFRLITDRRN